MLDIKHERPPPEHDQPDDWGFLFISATNQQKFALDRRRACMCQGPSIQQAGSLVKANLAVFFNCLGG